MQNLRVAKPSDDWIYRSFYHNINACTNFLFAYNHLRRPKCPIHDTECAAVPIETANQRRKYGKKGVTVSWKCPTCSWRVAITNGSYLSGKRLPLFKVIKLLYKFYQERTALQASNDDELSYDMCVVFFRWVRRCISHYMQHYFYPNFQFDLSHPIEVDECCFAGKRKHNRGRIVRHPIWVLGAVQRCTRLTLMQVVDDRTDPTLIPIIHRHCRPNAIIITDAWAAYNGLSILGFQHWSVNHTYTFRDPLTGWHSNTIENTFGVCKFDIRRHKGIPASELQSHLDAWCFKRNTEAMDQNYWEQLLMVVGAMQSFVPYS